MAKKTIWQRIKGWFTGEDKKKKKATPPATRVTMNEVRAQSNSPRRAYIDTIRGKDVKDEMRSLNSAYKAKKFDYADMTESIDNNLKVTPPTSKTASKLPAVDKRLANTVRKSEAKDSKNISAPSTGQRSKQWKVKTEAEEAGKRLTEYYKSQGSKANTYQNVKTKKYTPPEPTSKPTEGWFRVKTPEEMIKSGDYMYADTPINTMTPSADDRPTIVPSEQGYEKMYDSDFGRNLISLAYGTVMKGYTLDVLDRLIASSPYASDQAAYEAYQKNKSKGWETAGEILGTLASFGGSFGAYEKAVTKAGEKLFPKAAEKLAEKKLFQTLGKKGAEKAFGKTLAEVTSKEFADKVIADNARKIALKKAEQVLGVTVADLLQDATMGTIYDVTKASEYYEPFTNEWWKEVGRNKSASVFFNSLFALGRIGKGVTPRELAAISRAELAAKKGAEKAVAENADEIAENLRPQTIEDTLVNDTPELVRNADEAVDGVRPQTIEDTLINEPPASAVDDVANTAAKDSDEVADSLVRNADDAADSAKKEVPPTVVGKGKKTYTYEVFDNNGNREIITVRAGKGSEATDLALEYGSKKGMNWTRNITKGEVGGSYIGEVVDNGATKRIRAIDVVDDSGNTHTIDLTAGHTEEERALLRAKLNELEARANTLDATARTAAEKAELDSLRGDIGDIKSALERNVGVPAKRVSLDEVNARQAAREAEKAAERAKNAKPIEPPKKGEKPKPATKKATKAANEQLVLGEENAVKSGAVTETKSAANKTAKATKATKGAKATKAAKEQLVLGGEDATKAKAPKAKKGAKAAENTQATIGDEAASASKAEKPKKTSKPKNTKKAKKEATLGQQVKKVNKKIKNAVDNEQAERISNGVEIEGKWHDYNSQIRKASNGNVGMRKGAKTLGKNAAPIEQRRILAQMTRESNDYLNGFIENADASETLYGTMNAAFKERNMAKSYAKASEDVNKIINNIQNKLTRFIKDPDNGTDLKISDVTDIVAVKQVFHDAGMEVPPEVRGMFDRIILAQKTEHAQGLAVTEQILREFDPEIKGAYIKKDFDKFLSRFGNSSWDDVAEALDRKHNTNGYLKKKLEELIKFNSSKDGGKEEFRAMYKKLQTEILRNSKPSVWNLLDSVRHTFMLSNFATAMRNLFGNTSQRLMYDVADKINLGFESMIARKLKTDPEFAARFGTKELERTTSIIKHNTDNYRLMHEFTNGKLGETLSKKSKYAAKDSEYVEYLRKIIKDDVEDISGVQKLTPHLEYGVDYKPANLREAIVSETYKKANLGTRVVSFMLNEPDTWFVERNYRSALMKYLEANGITDMASLRGKEELFQRARAFATDVALENTYKKASRLATLIERSRAAGKRKGSNPLQWVSTVALDAEVPYTKVPINMFKNSAVYSPIGLVDGGTKAIKAIHSGDIVGLQRASLELSKSLTGIGLMALGFYLNCDEQEQMDEESWGVISSAAEYLKQYGVRDNSIKVGNYNFKIADIGMGATQLLMGAAYADAINDMGGAPPSLLDTPELVLEAFGSTFDVIGDVTLMENATGFIDAFGATNGNYGETKLSDRVKNAGAQIIPTYLNQFVPQPLRAVAKGTTEADLDTGVKKGDGTTPLGRNLKRGMNNYVQGIPYINENGILGYEGLPHKVDRHGNAVSAGLFPEGRDTVGKKILQSLDNFADPFSTRKINIPEADKVELNMRDEDGNPFLPREFDANRTYTAKIGKGDGAEVVDLTPKQRENAARSVKTSGKDMARALVYSKHAFFGDSHGDRAQQILRECPEDEEAAREYLYSLPEFQKLSNEEQIQYANALYYGGSGSGGERNYGGRARTSNRYVAVDINGYTDAEFRFANDLTKSEQAKYNDNNLGSKGVSKEDYVNAIEAIHYAEHEYKNGENIDTINGKKNIVAGILSLGLSQEENIAIYNAVKHKNWGDWDGATDVSSGSGKRRRRYGGYHRGGGGGHRKRKAPALKKSNYRASSKTYKDIASTLKTRSSSIGASSLQNVKVEPPKVKFKKYEV